ncbi:MAG TPA: TMEM175 family protein [Candidatus Paceibacterota bacterium]|nr:TMEM175 family protein [Candidatus Paceibacterota bacterium]
MLNKSRLENLSDGLFAIVLTLIVFDITIPTVTGSHTNAALLIELQALLPLLTEFLLSFLVLTMFWISHNYFYTYFATTINRQLMLLNLFYLALISFIPFSARVLGTYFGAPLAADLYGLNILLISVANIIILRYAVQSHEIETNVSPRLLRQARIRSGVTLSSATLGIVIAWISFPLALFLFVLPIIFNIVPGTLDSLEYLFGFSLD